MSKTEYKEISVFLTMRRDLSYQLEGGRYVPIGFRIRQYCPKHNYSDYDGCPHCFSEGMATVLMGIKNIICWLLCMRK